MKTNTSCPAPLRIVIRRSETEPHRRLIWIPVDGRKFQVSDFPAGRRLRLCAGIRGVRTAVVKFARPISAATAEQYLNRQGAHIGVALQEGDTHE